MNLLTDGELLRRYSTDGSEAAFAELVRRHLDRVYAIALRQVGGDAHLAKDVSQTVFTTLARKATPLATRAVLGGWLYHATRFAARDVVRAERRRRAREEDSMSHLRPDATTDADSSPLRETLDQLMNSLNDAERDAVWLRFFEGSSFADIGQRLRLTESAARMRVERALEKLRVKLGRRGVVSTPAAIATVLTAHAAGVAPAGLATAISASAVASAGGATMISSLLACVAGPKAITVVAGVVAAAGTAGFIGQRETNAQLRTEIEQLRAARLQVAAAPSAAPDLAALRLENERLTKAAAESATEVTTLLQAIERLRVANEQAKAQTSAVASRATYVVKPGDTAVKIAEALGTTPAALLAANPDTNWARLKVGQALQTPPGVSVAANATPLPAATTIETATAPEGWRFIQRGDSAVKIAEQTGLSLAQLKEFNPDTNWSRLRVGEKIRTAPEVR